MASHHNNHPHNWTPFEHRVFLSLLARGEHNASSTQTTNDQTSQHFVRKRYLRKSTPSSSDNNVLMDFTTRLNQGSHGKGNFTNDIPPHEVAAMIQATQDDRKGAMRIMERQQIGRLTRTMKRVWDREPPISFDGTITEWEGGRKLAEEKARQERDAREAARSAADGDGWAAIGSVEQDGNTFNSYTSALDVWSIDVAAATKEPPLDVWGKANIVVLTRTAGDDEWSKSTAQATTSNQVLDDGWGTSTINDGTVLPTSNYDPWGPSIPVSGAPKTVTWADQETGFKTNSDNTTSSAVEPGISGKMTNTLAITHAITTPGGWGALPSTSSAVVSASWWGEEDQPMSGLHTIADPWKAHTESINSTNTGSAGGWGSDEPAIGVTGSAGGWGRMPSASEASAPRTNSSWDTAWPSTTSSKPSTMSTAASSIAPRATTSAIIIPAEPRGNIAAANIDTSLVTNSILGDIETSKENPSNSGVVWGSSSTMHVSDPPVPPAFSGNNEFGLPLPRVITGQWTTLTASMDWGAPPAAPSTKHGQKNDENTKSPASTNAMARDVTYGRRSSEDKQTSMPSLTHSSTSSTAGEWSHNPSITQVCINSERLATLISSSSGAFSKEKPEGETLEPISSDLMNTDEI